MASGEYFPNVGRIQFEGPDSRNPLAFKHYNPDEEVRGRRMEDHLRFAVAYWHTMTSLGGDKFGEPTMHRAYLDAGDDMEMARARLDFAFEFFAKLGAPFFCFHDTDLAPEGESLAESLRRTDEMVELVKRKMNDTGVRVLFGSQNLFENRRFLAGAYTNPSPEVFAWAVAKARKMIEVCHELNAEGQAFWGGREGYDTLLNADVGHEQEQQERAAAVLNRGKRVAMLVGQGAAHAEDEVLEASELLGCGIAKALLARAHPPDDLPQVTGSIGLLGTKPSYEMVMNCDVLFMVGTSFPYSEWLPEEGDCTCVEIDIDGRYIGHRFPADVPLVGDSKATLRALLPLIERKEDRSWREKIEKEIEEWWAVMEDRAMQEGDPMNPQRVVSELSKRLPDNCILTADSGSSTNWWARHLRLRKGMDASLSGTLATMGPAAPYAIAARFAFPDRPVIATIGDGAFQMNGMNAMITVKRYMDRLMEKKQPLVFCVFNNEDLNQVTWEQRVMAGDPKFMGSQYVPDVPYAKFAELLGIKGIFCDDGDQVGAAWDEALATTDRPVVLEVKVDPEIPPLPPHIKFEQARHMMSALTGDEPERWDIVKKSVKGNRHNLIWQYPTKTFQTQAGRRWLAEVQLPPIDRLEMEMLLKEWEICDEQIEQVDNEIVQRASRPVTDDVFNATQILMTVPGVSHYSGLTLASRIGPIQRFPRPRSLANYFGLTPGCRNSGNAQDRLGSITKQGSKTARFILGQLVLHVLKHDLKMRDWYRRIKLRRGAKIARVAVMRRLTTIFWHMLTYKEPYAIGGPPPRLRDQQAAHATDHVGA